MRNDHLRLMAIVAAMGALTTCASHSYRLMRTGIITSREPRGVGHTFVPAMFVMDDTAYTHNACGHATLFILSPNVRVVQDNGAKSDTGALTVGRQVSVYVAEGAVILQSCPPETEAAKVILH